MVSVQAWKLLLKVLGKYLVRTALKTRVCETAEPTVPAPDHREVRVPRGGVQYHVGGLDTHSPQPAKLKCSRNTQGSCILSERMHGGPLDSQNQGQKDLAL